MEYLLPLFAILAFLFYWFNRDAFGSATPGWQTPKNAELVRVLMNLEPEPFEQLLSLYEKEFGEGPARYARQTCQKWKNGKVRPSNQTFRRFLINLPKVMSFDLKCEVVRELREAYCAHDRYSLTVSTDDWKEKLIPVVNKLVERDFDELPYALQRKLSWLAQDDAQVASMLLHQSQRQDSLNKLALLEAELSHIEVLLVNRGHSSVKHTIRLPYGTVELKIKRR